MSYVQEQFIFPTENPFLQGDVVEKTQKEIDGGVWEKWRIISLNIDKDKEFTPDEVILLGETLIELGKRVKKEYKSTGKAKK